MCSTNNWGGFLLYAFYSLCSGRHISPTGPWCMSQSRAYSAAGSSAASGCSARCPAYRRLRRRRSPYWRWTRPGRTTGTPENGVDFVGLVSHSSKLPLVHSQYPGSSRRGAACARRTAPGAGRSWPWRWSRAACRAWPCCGASRRGASGSASRPGPAPASCAGPSRAGGGTRATAGTVHISPVDAVQTNVSQIIVGKEKGKSFGVIAARRRAAGGGNGGKWQWGGGMVSAVFQNYD